MFREMNKDIQMRAGDYGVPLPFQLRQCCCADELLDSDVFQLSISKCGRELVSRQWTMEELEDGALTLILTSEESAVLPPDLYAWKLTLKRKGETENTLTSGVWLVGTYQ